MRTSDVELKVGMECGGVSIVELGNPSMVKCGRCRSVFAMTKKSIRQRVRHPSECCLRCKNKGSVEGLPRGFKGCRTCDDCPALRPIGGCPACGEPSSKGRAA